MHDPQYDPRWMHGVICGGAPRTASQYTVSDCSARLFQSSPIRIVDFDFTNGAHVAACDGTAGGFCRTDESSAQTSRYSPLKSLTYIRTRLLRAIFAAFGEGADSLAQ